ncbi:MAG: PAS domain-containing protein [Actinomycetota bacterium]|nr:PAS domain-containing protein [Actinomycetota bacterium]
MCGTAVRRAGEGSHIAGDRTDEDRGEELEVRYRTLVERVPAIVYVWGVIDGIEHISEEYVSPQIEEVLGFRPDEWTANPSLWMDQIHPKDRAEVIEETSRSVEAGEPFKMEYRMLTKDGRVVWLHDVASVVSRDNQGRATRYQGVQLDITARKEAEHAQRRSFERLRLLSDQRRELLTRVVRTQEEERRRIAEELHDDTMPKLFAIPMWMESVAKNHPEMEGAEAFVGLRQEVSDSVARLRHLALELHPRLLDTEGLVAAVRTYLDGWKELGASPEYEITSRLTKEPPREARFILYRIALEAVSNARRHSEASLVTVSLTSQVGGFILLVEDDGVGFDVTTQASTHQHIGLAAMWDRAEVAGGWCRIDSRPGRTKVEAWVPERLPDDPGPPHQRPGPMGVGIQLTEEPIDPGLASRGLTPREIEVARLLALGYTNAEIAASLHVSSRTIEIHCAAVFRQLGVRSRAALVDKMQGSRKPSS